MWQDGSVVDDFPRDPIDSTILSCLPFTVELDAFEPGLLEYLHEKFGPPMFNVRESASSLDDVQYQYHLHARWNEWEETIRFRHAQDAVLCKMQWM